MIHNMHVLIYIIRMKTYLSSEKDTGFPPLPCCPTTEKRLRFRITFLYPAIKPR